jgi:hypothetical protein
VQRPSVQRDGGGVQNARAGKRGATRPQFVEQDTGCTRTTDAGAGCWNGCVDCGGVERLASLETSEIESVHAERQRHHLAHLV